MLEEHEEPLDLRGADVLLEGEHPLREPGGLRRRLVAVVEAQEHLLYLVRRAPADVLLEVDAAGADEGRVEALTSRCNEKRVVVGDALTVRGSSWS